MDPESPCSRCGGKRDRTGKDGKSIQGYCAKCRREYASKRFKEDPAHKYEIINKSNAKLKADIIAGYGGCCTCCGEKEVVFLTIDHVFNDGAVERAGKSGGGFRQYRLLRKLGYPRDRYQLLCRNCNWAKHAEGMCPHQRPTLTIET